MPLQSLNQLDRRLAGLPDESEQGQYEQAHPLVSELQKVPGYAANAAMNLPGNMMNMASQVPAAAKKIMTHPIDAPRDFLGGVMDDAQHIASAGLEGGEFLTRKGAEKMGKWLGHPVNVPKWNAREFMGLEGNNKFDLGKAIASNDPDPLIYGLGKSLSMAAGGSKFLPAVGASVSHAVRHADPNDRVQAATEGAVNAAIPLAVGKTVGQGAKIAKNLHDYATPAGDAEALVKHLGQGSKTAEQNIKELTTSIKNSYDKNVSSALDLKSNVIKSAGNQKINNSEYVSNINKATELFDDQLQEVHDNFVKDPTFENADKLQSQIGNEIGYYQRLSKRGNLQPGDKAKLSELVRIRKLINKDQDALLESIDPKLKTEYGTFKSDWKNNVVPYQSSQVLRNIIQKGGKSGTTRGNIRSEFSFPDDIGTKISEDIGQGGKNRILFNEVVGTKPGDVSGLAKSILESKRLKGYEEYVSPEVEQTAESLGNRAVANKRYNTLKSGAAGGAIGLMAGHPLIGAGLGLGFNYGIPLAKHLTKYGKK